MKIEEAFTDLENIISKLEDKEIQLDEAFKEYERGVKLVRECNESLDKVEKDITVLQNEEQK